MSKTIETKLKEKIMKEVASTKQFPRLQNSISDFSETIKSILSFKLDFLILKETILAIILLLIGFSLGTRLEELSSGGNNSQLINSDDYMVSSIAYGYYIEEKQ
ncbi:MAG: hypothetical protein N4A44_01090 [Alphaproteobacteria bacterium]|jgi:hypothetical protein|nr:hypothetical protein [Alphaproteobacteria bacterium]